MARATFVKKARRAVPSAGIEVGDSYYWWKFRFGGKRYSKTAPKPSQLTQSEYYGTLYSIQEDAEDGPDFENLESQLEDIKSQLEQLRDQQEEKRDNMPDALQDSETGQLLQDRYDSLDSAISELDCIDIPNEEDVTNDLKDGYANEKEWDDLDEERRKELIEEAKQEKAGELWNEVTAALEQIS